MVTRMGLQEELIAALDAERVVTGADERRRHGTDEGWHSAAAPDLVVYPRSTEEAAAVVRICAAHGTPIVPFGAGTSLEGHVAALAGRGERRHDADERDHAALGRGHGRDRAGGRDAPPARREAAARGRVLQRRPGRGRDASAGWPRPAPRARRASATARCARTSFALTVVTADGEIVRTRSRARKSSAGYDLTRLFIGSEGTLGLITRDHAAPAADARGDDRRRPPPSTRSTAAVDTVIEVLAHAIPVARIELLDDVQIDAVNRHFELDLEVAPTLFLEFHGSHPRRPKAQAEEVGEIAAGHGVHGLRTGPPTRPSAARCGAPATAPTRPAARCAPARRASPPTPASRSPALAEVIAETKADLDASGLVAPIVGHVGDGNFHLAILVDPDDPEELAARQDAQRPAGAARDRRRGHLHRRARRRLRQERRSSSSSTARTSSR